MTEDVAHYVSLAREADGPIVELMVGSGRVAIESCARQASPCSASTRRRRCSRSRASVSAGLPLELRFGRRARARARRARGADLRARSARFSTCTAGQEKRRVFERVAASLRPGGRFAFNAFVFSHTIAARLDGDDAGPERRRAHAPLRPGGQPHRDRAGRRRDDPDLVGHEVRVGRAARRSPGSRWKRSTAASTGSRSTTSPSSSSTSRGSPERLRPDRVALRPVERERRRGRLVLRRRGARGGWRSRGARRRHRPDRHSDRARRRARDRRRLVRRDAGRLRRAGTGGRRRGAARPAARRPAPAAGGRARLRS